MDFGAAAAKYIDAFFQNIQWEAVSARLAAASATKASGRNAGQSATN
jgi:Fe-Mn family superoxide dismutase